MISVRRIGMQVVCAVAIVSVAAGCGLIADKGRAKVAKIGDHIVTRAEFERYIRNIPPDQKPNIRNRGVLQKVLESYLDSEVKRMLKEDLLADGKLESEEEVKRNRARAEAIWAARNPDQANFDPQDPEKLGLSQADVDGMKQVREQGIEEVYQELLAASALSYAIQEAVEAKTLTIEESEYAEEYEFRKAELFNPERVTVRGLLFPVAPPQVAVKDAGPKAADVRKRVVGGEAWDTVAKEYVDAKTAIPFQSSLERNNQPKFANFWELASGASAGKVIGPTIIEGWEVTVRNAQGQIGHQPLPPGYFVCEVVEQRPQTQMTLEEAKQVLAPELYFVKMMKRLREERGVKVYEENLWDPTMFQEKSDDPLLDALPQSGGADPHAGHTH